MEQLNALLARKRALTAELQRIKGNFDVKTGIMALATGQLAQFGPMAHVITELLEVYDAITETMAIQLTQRMEV